MDVVQIQDVCSHKATQRFLSEQVQPSVRQPFPEPFHRHHELFGQSHRDGVVVIRFGETRSQRHNVEIERLRRELQQLQNITPADLAPIGKNTAVVTPQMEISFPRPKLKIDDIKIAASEYSRRMGAIWASDNSTLLQKNVADTVAMVGNYTQTLTNKGVAFSVAMEHVSQTVATTMQRFDEQVSAFLADSIVAAAEALGQIICKVSIDTLQFFFS